MWIIVLTMEKFLIKHDKPNASSGDTEPTHVGLQSSEDSNRKRRYKDSFLELGFCSIIDGGVEKPRCLICETVLCSESLKRSKLKRHFKTKHKDHTEKPLNFFKKLPTQYESQGCSFKRLVSTSEKALRASFEVSYRIAQTRKPHTIAESLVLPAAMDMTRILCGKEVADKLKAIPLSNGTVKRRITAISDSQEDKLIARLKVTDSFALQADVSTEGQTAHLLTYVRYAWDEDILEDFLFCITLPERETADAMFEVLSDYFDKNEIPWTNLVGFCTDGAPNMAGKRSGLQTLISRKAPDCVWTHCMLHREQLMTRELCPELDKLMRSVVTTVNYIKTRPHKARLFTSLCRDFNSEHEVLLYHTEIRWLSRGNVLSRFFELRHEISHFMTEEGSPQLVEFLESKDDVILLAYLCDIFSKLNELNVSMQGKSANVLTLNDKLSAFRGKLRLWTLKVEKQEFTQFPTVNFFKTQYGSIADVCRKVMHYHLRVLHERMQCYFPKLDIATYDWIRNPFNADPLQEKFAEELIELQNNRDLLSVFKNTTISQFWSKAKETAPSCSREARRILVLFATSYLCEAGFSALVSLKTKYRNRLDVTADMRCTLSQISPDFDQLCSSTQAQLSH